MQCPICRQWNLYGPDFGFPESGKAPQTPNYIIDSLYQLLDKLDGCTHILLRVDNTFYDEEREILQPLSNPEGF